MGRLAGLLVLVSMLMGQSLFAEHALTVNVKQEKSRVQIRFETVEMKSAICSMEPVLLTLETVMPTSDGVEQERGTIFLVARVDPGKPCLTAMGRHSGVLEFERGYQWPKLNLGRYSLTINGEDYGTLIVEKNSVKLR